MNTRTWGLLGWLALFFVIVLLLASCGAIARPPAGIPALSPTAPTQARVGLAAPQGLGALTVAPDSTAPGYDRERRFQDDKGWPSIGKGCTLRDAILAQDMTEDRFVPGSTCKVLGGVLYGVPTPASGADIDHVIPLRLAWASGAWRWNSDHAGYPSGDAKRRAFATDPGELRAERSAGNRGNGAVGPERSDPGSDRCAYAQRYVATALKWRLTVTPERKTALSKLLKTCR